jgi:hypothetical protein
MALDTTVGGANADSYASLVEADAYVANNRPTGDSDPWVDLEEAQREAALRMAAQYLDAAFPWTGSAVDAVQAMCWPRSGMLSRNGFAIATTTIPNELKKAQCEYARQLSAEDPTESDSAKAANLESVKAGSVELSFQPWKTEGQQTSVELMNASIQLKSPEFAYLTKAVPDSVRMLIPSSWYTQGSVGMALMFEVVGDNRADEDC